MTIKSLKHSHSKNCLGLKKTIDKASSEKVSKTIPPPPQESPPIKNSITLPEKTVIEKQPEVVEPEHPRVVRMRNMKEKYNHLVKNAFLM